MAHSAGTTPAIAAAFDMTEPRENPVAAADNPGAAAAAYPPDRWDWSRTAASTDIATDLAMDVAAAGRGVDAEKPGHAASHRRAVAPPRPHSRAARPRRARTPSMENQRRTFRAR